MKLQIPEQATTAISPTGPVLVRPYQVVLPVRLVFSNTRSSLFPAVLDTGHSHNLSIREEHFRNWVKATPKQSGYIRVNNQLVPLVDGDLELEGVLLKCPEGIAVYPANHPSAPRLPLLGLRVLVKNGLRVVIDGGQKEVTIT